MNKELAASLHPYSQMLNVQVETSNNRCSAGVLIKADTV